jgi:hypothetical protein
MAGLDDVNPDLEEALLRRELRRLEATRAGSLDERIADLEAAMAEIAKPMVATRG